VSVRNVRRSGYAMGTRSSSGAFSCMG
jgi:hypothetical protein